MFQRDYILRLIEQMSQFIGQVVFKLKKEEKFEEAMDELDAMLHRLSLPKGKVLQTIAVDDMLQMLQKDEEVEVQKIGAIASILKEQADIYERTGDENNAWSAAVKSLHYHLVWHRLTYQSEPSTDIDLLYDDLSKYELSPRIYEEAALYYERLGRFDLAENLWYDLCETNDPGSLHKTKQFYERLLNHDDNTLEQSNLPRNEVEEGLQQLISRISSSPAHL